MRKFDLLYLNEKVEELRSRVALINSSVNTLDQIFFNIYNKFIMKRKIPPFIYPRMQIEELRKELEKLMKDINKIENEEITSDEKFFMTLFLSLAFRMAGLESRCEDILSSSQELLKVLEQRILDLEIFDDLKYSENLQHEFIGLTKVFESVDALSYELLKRTLGENWIKDKKFAPVTILGEKDYCIDTESYVINIPYHDCFRSRYWAGLSHEVAHVFAHHYFFEIREKEFVDVVERNVFKLGMILKSLFHDIDGKPMAEYPIFSQIFELICDIIACFTCGPPPLLSLCSYDKFSLSEVFLDGGQRFRIWRSSHPPLFFRILVMKKTLEHTGILNVDKDLLEYVSSVEDVAGADAGYALDEFGVDFLPDSFSDYSDFTAEISNDILGFLDKLAREGKIECFGRHEFGDLVKSLRKAKLGELTPVDAMNVVWLKRRARTFEKPNLSTKDFYEERKRETKIFETTVNLCYNYYEKTVFPETREYTYEGAAL